MQTKIIMDSQDIEPITFAESVVRWPKMWTAKGSLEEVVALFDGYEIAIRHSKFRSTKRPTPSDALQWFVNEAKSESEVISNFQLIEVIRLKFGNDEKAFKALSNWLEEFRYKHDAD